jgi:inhibitor of cysteine peptidase
MLKLTNADNGGKAELRVGESFELQLSENPTTGYRWRLPSPLAPSPLGPLFEVEDDSFAGPQGTFGAGGVRVWRLRAVLAGVTHLVIENRRSWEPQPVGTFEVAIDVKAP